MIEDHSTIDFEARRRFVVIASQRTGSTLLVRSLDTCPDIFCAGELFHLGPRTLHHEFQFPFLRARRGIVEKAIAIVCRPSRVRRHLRLFYSVAGPNCRAVGFKLMISQASAFPAIVPWLRKQRVAAFLLYRRNAFETALSYYKAQESGRFHLDGITEARESRIVSADEAEFRRLFETCRADRDRLLGLRETLGGSLLAYEDLVGQWDESIAGMGRELGIPDLRVQKALEKLAGNDQLVISNEQELRKKFHEGHFQA